MSELYPLSKTKLNDKEKLAIDLYLSAQHERTTEAKFLFLINTVECLSEEKEQTDEITGFIDSVLDDISKRFPNDKSLSHRMKFLKKRSIRQGCKDLITNFLIDAMK